MTGANAEETNKAAKGDAYHCWKEETLMGLTLTQITPTTVSGEWTRAAYFDGDTPGTWFATGDHWERAMTAGGAVIYRRLFGSGALYYAPSGVISEWAQHHYEERLRAHISVAAVAREILHESLWDSVGGEVAKAVVAIYGVEYFIAQAQQEEWVVPWANRPSEASPQTVAEHFGIPYTCAILYRGSVLRFTLPKVKIPFPVRDYPLSAVYRTDDGRWFGLVYNGYYLHPLTTEQLETLRLPMGQRA